MIAALFDAVRPACVLAGIMLCLWFARWARTAFAPLALQWWHQDLEWFEVRAVLRRDMGPEPSHWFWLSVLLVGLIGPLTFSLPLLSDMRLFLAMPANGAQQVAGTLAAHALLWAQMIKIGRVAPRPGTALGAVVLTYWLALILSMRGAL